MCHTDTKWHAAVTYVVRLCLIVALCHPQQNNSVLPAVLEFTAKPIGAIYKSIVVGSYKQNELSLGDIRKWNSQALEK